MPYLQYGDNILANLNSVVNIYVNISIDFIAHIVKSIIVY